MLAIVASSSEWTPWFSCFRNFQYGFIIMTVWFKNAPSANGGFQGKIHSLEDIGPFRNAKWQALNHPPPLNAAAQFFIYISLSWSNVVNDIPLKSSAGLSGVIWVLSQLEKINILKYKHFSITWIFIFNLLP